MTAPSTRSKAEGGETVMEAAMRGSVSGIVAECGGSCTCATCHVYVDDGMVRQNGRSLGRTRKINSTTPTMCAQTRGYRARSK